MARSINSCLETSGVALMTQLEPGIYTAFPSSYCFMDRDIDISSDICIVAISILLADTYAYPVNHTTTNNKNQFETNHRQTARNLFIINSPSQKLMQLLNLIAYLLYIEPQCFTHILLKTMPYKYKRKQACKNKSDEKGTYATMKKSDNEQQCWKSKAAFERSQTARHARKLKELDSIPEKIYKKPADDSDLGFKKSRFEFPELEPLPIDRDIELYVKEQLLKKYIRKLILEISPYRKNN